MPIKISDNLGLFDCDPVLRKFTYLVHQSFNQIHQVKQMKIFIGVTLKYLPDLPTNH